LLPSRGGSGNYSLPLWGSFRKLFPPPLGEAQGGGANLRQVPFSRSGVDLPRSGDLLLRIEEAFLPLRQPTRRAPNGEQHREHLDRKADGRVDDARVEVDVGVEPVLDEVVVP